MLSQQGLLMPVRPASQSADQQDANSGDGIDRTLIQWMLGLTPQQRLDVLQDHVTLVTRLSRGQDTD
jgi:hypothetical protein